MFNLLFYRNLNVTFRKRGEGVRQKDVYKGQNRLVSVVTDRSSLKTFLIC